MEVWNCLIIYWLILILIANIGIITTKIKTKITITITNKLINIGTNYKNYNK
jgi:hypothetical protein